MYSRWGDLIYQYNGDYYGWQGWDGRANGGVDIAQDDVYVWIIKTVDFNGVEHDYVGHVTLLTDFFEK